MKIDYIVTYVNPLDKEWQNSYIKEINNSDFDDSRFRDYGFFKFTLLSLLKNMSFLNSIIILVSSKSQIESDTTLNNIVFNNSKIRVVEHSDFIPKEFLPTFNSNTIESFLWNIPNLSDYIIYGNDDFYALNPSKESDWFKDLKPIIYTKPCNGISVWHRKVHMMYDSMLGNSTITFPIIRHWSTPLLKCDMIETFKTHKDKVLNSLTPLRRDMSKNWNYYQYAYTSIFKNNFINGSDLNFGGYISFKPDVRGRYISYEILHTKTKIFAVNDTKNWDKNDTPLIYNALKTKI